LTKDVLPIKVKIHQEWVIVNFYFYKLTDVFFYSRKNYFVRVFQVNLKKLTWKPGEEIESTFLMHEINVLTI
jgi:hypothetical protein